MIRALNAGAAYFTIVFAAGFLLGTVRTLALAPLLGSVGAVLVELPVMLAVSWFACGWALRRFAVPPAVLPRAVMGGLAFTLLMAAELGISIFLLGRTPAAHLAHYRETEALLGLAAQVAFAAFPLVRR